MSGQDDGPILIGLDGGATKFAAYEVIVENDAEGCLALSPGFGHAEEPVPQLGATVPFERQLYERDAPEITIQEIKVGRLWSIAAARAIARAAKGHHVIRLGVCMPGLKTPDSRGISVLRNGPRMPRFADILEDELSLHGIRLVAGIPHLIGDGEACGLGERLACGGLFRGVENAYYVGGGTGVAEAMLLEGTVSVLDQIDLLRAWEMRNSAGICYEDLIAQKHMNDRYERYAGRKLRAVDGLEKSAVAGDPMAIRVFKEAADALADLIEVRTVSFRYLGGRPRKLQRVVLGQHTGRLFRDRRLPMFRDRLESTLKERLKLSGKFLESHVVGSDLRAAPAIGAASTAL
ncbi:MAG: ROK family protein [Patescibacteria group bacterium]|nr:ROK family protein [Patescibacteria group bacterium]